MSAPTKASPVAPVIVRTSTEDRAFSALVYGPPGGGKSTLVSGAPGATLLPIEPGLGMLDMPQLLVQDAGAPGGHRRPATWEESLQLVRGAPLEKGQTLVFDSASAAEAMIIKYICRRDNGTIKQNNGVAPLMLSGGRPNIKAYGYDDGWKVALEEWRILTTEFERLMARGVHIAITAHSTTHKFKNPAGLDYAQIGPAVQTLGMQWLTGWANAVLYLTLETEEVSREFQKGVATRAKATTTGARLLVCDWYEAAIAKNRYGLPATVPLPELGTSSDPAKVWEVVGRFVEPVARAKYSRQLAAELEKRAAASSDASLATKIRGWLPTVGNRPARLLAALARLDAPAQEAAAAAAAAAAQVAPAATEGGEVAADATAGE